MADLGGGDLIIMVFDQQGTASINQRLSIVELMSISMMWVGQEDRWNGIGLYLAHRVGTGSGDGHGCRTPRQPHLIHEWCDACSNACFLISLLKYLGFTSAGEVNDLIAVGVGGESI